MAQEKSNRNSIPWYFPPKNPPADIAPPFRKDLRDYFMPLDQKSSAIQNGSTDSIQHEVLAQPPESQQHVVDAPIAQQEAMHQTVDLTLRSSSSNIVDMGSDVVDSFESTSSAVHKRKSMLPVDVEENISEAQKSKSSPSSKRQRVESNPDAEQSSSSDSSGTAQQARHKTKAFYKQVLPAEPEDLTVKSSSVYQRCSKGIKKYFVSKATGGLKSPRRASMTAETGHRNNALGIGHSDQPRTPLKKRKSKVVIESTFAADEEEEDDNNVYGFVEEDMAIEARTTRLGKKYYENKNDEVLPVKKSGKRSSPRSKYARANQSDSTRASMRLSIEAAEGSDKSFSCRYLANKNESKSYSLRTRKSSIGNYDESEPPPENVRRPSRFASEVSSTPPPLLSLSQEMHESSKDSVECSEDELEGSRALDSLYVTEVVEGDCLGSPIRLKFTRVGQKDVKMSDEMAELSVPIQEAVEEFVMEEITPVDVTHKSDKKKHSKKKRKKHERNAKISQYRSIVKKAMGHPQHTGLKQLTLDKRESGPRSLRQSSILNRKAVEGAQKADQLKRKRWQQQRLYSPPGSPPLRRTRSQLRSEGSEHDDVAYEDYEEIVPEDNKPLELPAESASNERAWNVQDPDVIEENDTKENEVSPPVPVKPPSLVKTSPKKRGGRKKRGRFAKKAKSSSLIAVEEPIVTAAAIEPTTTDVIEAESKKVPDAIPAVLEDEIAVESDPIKPLEVQPQEVQVSKRTGRVKRTMQTTLDMPVVDHKIKPSETASENAQPVVSLRRVSPRKRADASEADSPVKAHEECPVETPEMASKDVELSQVVKRGRGRRKIVADPADEVVIPVSEQVPEEPKDASPNSSTRRGRTRQKPDAVLTEEIPLEPQIPEQPLVVVSDDVEPETPLRRGRGRPKVQAALVEEPAPQISDQIPDTSESIQQESPVRRGRGRQRAQVAPVEEPEPKIDHPISEASEGIQQESPVRRGRGRQKASAASVEVPESQIPDQILEASESIQQESPVRRGCGRQKALVAPVEVHESQMPNPILEASKSVQQESPVRRGRGRQKALVAPVEVHESQMPNPISEASESVQQESPVRRGRGRRKAQIAPIEEFDPQTSDQIPDPSESTLQGSHNRRGSGRLKASHIEESEPQMPDASGNNQQFSARRGRGRPKSQVPAGNEPIVSDSIQEEPPVRIGHGRQKSQAATVEEPETIAAEPEPQISQQEPSATGSIQQQLPVRRGRGRQKSQVAAVEPETIVAETEPQISQHEPSATESIQQQSPVRRGRGRPKSQAAAVVEPEPIVAESTNDLPTSLESYPSANLGQETENAETVVVEKIKAQIPNQPFEASKDAEPSSSVKRGRGRPAKRKRGGRVPGISLAEEPIAQGLIEAAVSDDKLLESGSKAEEKMTPSVSEGRPRRGANNETPVKEQKATEEVVMETDSKVADGRPKRAARKVVEVETKSVETPRSIGRPRKAAKIESKGEEVEQIPEETKGVKAANEGVEMRPRRMTRKAESEIQLPEAPIEAAETAQDAGDRSKRTALKDSKEKSVAELPETAPSEERPKSPPVKPESAKEDKKPPKKGPVKGAGKKTAKKPVVPLKELSFEKAATASKSLEEERVCRNFDLAFSVEEAVKRLHLDSPEEVPEPVEIVYAKRSRPVMPMTAPFVPIAPLTSTPVKAPVAIETPKKKDDTAAKIDAGKTRSTQDMGKAPGPLVYAKKSVTVPVLAKAVKSGPVTKPAKKAAAKNNRAKSAVVNVKNIAADPPVIAVKSKPKEIILAKVSKDNLVKVSSVEAKKKPLTETAEIKPATSLPLVKKDDKSDEKTAQPKDQSKGNKNFETSAEISVAKGDQSKAAPVCAEDKAAKEVTENKKVEEMEVAVTKGTVSVAESIPEKLAESSSTKGFGKVDDIPMKENDKVANKDDMSVKKDDVSEKDGDKLIKKDNKPLAKDDKSVKKDDLHKDGKPAMKDNKPVTKDNKPVSKDDRPVKKDDKPAKKDDKSAAKDDEPVKKDDKPVSKDERAVKKDDKPAKKDDKPIGKNDEPVKKVDVQKDNKPLKKDDRPVTKDDESATKDDRPVKKDDKLLTKDDKPVKKDDKLVKKDDVKKDNMSIKEDSVQKDDKLVKKDDKPVTKDNESAKKDDKLVKKNDKPVTKDDKSAKKEEKPVKKDDKLVKKDDKPVKKDDKPIAKVDESVKKDYKPATEDNKSVKKDDKPEMKDNKPVRKLPERKLRPRENECTKKSTKEIETVEIVKKPAVKLAPLFCKKEKKKEGTSNTPPVKKALTDSQLEFLRSAGPTSSKRPSSPVVVDNAPCSQQVFHKVVHVQQKDATNPMWALKNADLKLRNTAAMCHFKSDDKFTHKTDVSSSSSRKVDYELPESLPEEIIMKVVEDNDKSEIAAKKLYDRYLSYKLAAESGAGSTSSGARICSSSWPDKYQPKNDYEIIGNGASVSTLFSWLEKWKIEAGKSNDDLSSKKNTQSDQDSDYEPEDKKSKKQAYADDDDDDEEDEMCNTMLLVGPHGVGKTSSVYALANQLGFKVFEVNASSRRSGKQITSQLHEVTQSMQVTKAKNQSQSSSLGIGSFFKTNKSTDTPDGNDSIGLTVSSSALLLFEDVDLIFDEDEGFYGAVCNFMANTKRPIILTTNDPLFSLTNKIKEDFEELEFQSPSAEEISRYLRLMCLAEDVAMDLQDIQRIVKYYKCDIRQSILALQYLIGCGGWKRSPGACIDKLLAMPHLPTINSFINTKSSSSQQDILSDYSKCQIDVIDSNYPDIIELYKNCDKTKTSQTLATISTFLNNLSACDSLLQTSAIDSITKPGKSIEHVSDQTLDHWRLDSHISSAINSMNLCQTFKSLNNISDSKNDLNISFDNESAQNLKYLKKLKCDQEALKTCGAMPLTCYYNQGAKAMDYVPTLRSICKSEIQRSSSSSKRSGRFLHYLDSISVELSASNQTSLTSYFK